MRQTRACRQIKRPKMWPMLRPTPDMWSFLPKQERKKAPGRKKEPQTKLKQNRQHRRFQIRDLKFRQAKVRRRQPERPLLKLKERWHPIPKGRAAARQWR